MRKLITFVFLGVLFSFSVQGQVNLMSNSVVTACSGNFQSSIGFTSTGSGYQVGENFTMTFCPGAGGSIVSMDFLTFALGTGDVLSVYNGMNSSAPLLGVYDATNPLFGVIGAISATNPSGCLTFVFVSDSVSESNGWFADISCTFPCQQFEIAMDSLSPDTSLGAFVDLCDGDTAYLSATGLFLNNNQNYNQTDSNTQFYWYLDTVLIDSGSSILFPPDSTGAFMLQIFAVDSMGCEADFNLNQWIRVATEPDFSPSYVAEDTVCFGDTNILYIGTLSTPWTNSDTLVSAPTTFLPDGSSGSPGVYNNTLTFSKFGSGDTISSASQILRFWLNMEHSFIGDLSIKMTCPNGNSSILKNFPGGGGRWLGAACDGNNTPTPGIGWDYEWKPAANALTNMVAHIGGGCVGCVAVANPCNALQTGSALQSSSYNSFQPISNMVGCPLNGTWTLTITDQWAIDNGFLFNWGIDFDSALYPSTVVSYDPGIDSIWLDSAALATTVSSSPDSLVMLPMIDDTTICYTVNVLDGFGCTHDTTLCFFVRDMCNPICYVPASPVWVVDKVSCPYGADGGLKATPDPGEMPFPWTYTWTDPLGNVIQTTVASVTADSISGLSQGMYNLQIIDGNGCTSNWPKFVGTIQSMQSTVAGITQTSCAGIGCDASATAICFYGTTPYSYLWSSGDTLANTTSLCAGSNYVYITDANGCIDTNVFSVGEPDSIVASGFGDTLICYGNSTTISGSATGGTPPYSYSWNQGVLPGQTASVSPLNNKSYMVYVTDANNCPTDSAEVVISVRPPLSLTFDSPDTLCPDDIVDLLAYPHGGDSIYSFVWEQNLGTTPGVQTTVVASQFYTVTLTDACNSVPAIDSVWMQVGGYPQLYVSTTPDDTVCIGEPFYLYAQAAGGDGNFTYEWDNSLGFGQAKVVVPTATTSYVVTVVDECFSPAGYDTVILTVGDFGDFVALVDTNENCDPATFHFSFDTINTSFIYEMNFGNGYELVNPSTDIERSFEEDGCHDVKVRLTTKFGCETEKNYPCLFTVLPSPVAVFDFNPHSPDIHQPFVDFWDESIGANSWNWYLNETIVNQNEQFTFPLPDSGLYNMKLVVSNDFGCLDSTNTDFPLKFTTSYFLPTGFTPDGNGINDEFNVVAEGLQQKDFHMQIFDRWGGMVFDNTDRDIGWNGQMQNSGDMLMNGIYMYIVTFRLHDSRKITINGQVSLLR